METDWVQEFDGFTDGPPTTTQSKHGTSQIDQLEQELKLLHWHKLANEAALKAALIRTKQLKEQDSGRAVVESRKERAQWMQQIIEEEQSRPLEVTEDFILKYEEKQRLEEERLEEEVQRHIKSLQRIKTNLKEKEEMRRRTMIYRTKRKALLAPLGMGSSSGSSSSGGHGENFSLPNVAGPMTPSGPPVGNGTGGMQGTLSKVINSLDKLVDLEKRIARLEVDTDGTDTPQRTQLKFKKGRQEATPTQSARNVFTVREVPRKNKSHGQSPQRRGGSPSGGGGGGGGGGRSRSRGREGGRNANDERRRLREEDEQRDDQVMEDWMDKKKRQEIELAQKRRRNAAQSEKTKSQRNDMKMQNFGDIRKEYDKKKERTRRKVAQSGGNDEDEEPGGRGRGRNRRGNNTVQPTRSGRSKSQSRMSKSTGKRSKRR